MIRRFQRWLDEQGFKPGPIDGVFGLHTAAAYRRWLRKNAHTLPRSLDYIYELPPIVGEFITDVVSHIPPFGLRDAHYGHFEYEDVVRITTDHGIKFTHKTGRIKIVDQYWIPKYLVEPKFPLIGAKGFNRRAAPYLYCALAELEFLKVRIERADTWVPRHIRWDPERLLSNHSWGIAIDIDPEHNKAREVEGDEQWLDCLSKASNYRMQVPGGPKEWTPTAGTVRFVMTRWGFSAGGDWPGHHYPAKGFCDPMHFELLRH